VAPALEELLKLTSPLLDEASAAEVRAITAAPFVNSR
jgi:hypothetical protein